MPLLYIKEKLDQVERERRRIPPVKKACPMTPSEQARKVWEANSKPVPRIIECGKRDKWFETREFRQFKNSAFAWLGWKSTLIEILGLETIKAQRGGATELLLFIQHIADSHGLGVYTGIKANPPVWPLPDGRLLNQRELEEWYSRRGFQVIRDKWGTYGLYP